MHLLSLFSSALLASSALANPAALFARGTCNADNCARAITGTNAQPAIATRKTDCNSVLNAGAAVPTYASACSGAVRYSSACSCLGITASPTTTTTTTTTLTSSIATTSSTTTAILITSATATTTTSSKPKPTCLNKAAATTIVHSLISILTNPDRQASKASAQVLIADGYTETSDSINSLAGYPLGSTTFSGIDNYITSLLYAPPIPAFTTLEIFHDCSKIAWYWIVTGLGSGVDEVKGINLIHVTSGGQIAKMDLEFNSIAWGTDTGLVCARAGNGTKV